MRRTGFTTITQTVNIELTADEVLSLIRSGCSAPRSADVELDRNGCATIRWSKEETAESEPCADEPADEYLAKRGEGK
jgi:hypothetical protein